tara:strand:- start:235 stop:987 length:753 start_codon:yes stop_codon:yes gene_type:complete
MNTQEIKRGDYNAYYPISKLKMAKMNRDIVESHVKRFKSKLNEYGWMMPIVVSQKGDIIEGHNRIESAKLLNQKTVPAYVIEWVDTSKEREHLNAIIGLNNGNKSWNTADYLKSFSAYNDDYKIVYDSYLKNINNISVGNVVCAFFGKTKGKGFKQGTSKIIDLEFSFYLLNKISLLVSKHSKRKIQAYCVREMINVAFISAKRDIKITDYLFKKYDNLATTNNAVLTSINEFKPTMETYLNNYKNKNTK